MTTFDIAAYRHDTPIQVRWADMDSLGHINNAKFLTYCEHARIAYFNALGLWDGNLEQIGLIMARVVIDFKLPAFWGDDLHVLMRTARFGTRSFDTHHLIVRRSTDGTDAVVVAAVITLVTFNYHTQSSVPIPEAWRAALIAYEPTPIET
jgi:acyl-CoA thioester hydrolase